MTFVYRPNSLVSADGTVIALIHIESISQVSKEEDAVIDKLKDDLTFIVTTVSGCKHSISVNRLVKAYRGTTAFDSDMHNTYMSILDRWIHLLGT